MHRIFALLLFLGLELLLVSALESWSWANPPGVYSSEADLQQLPEGAWTLVQLVLCGHVSGSIGERYALGDKSEVGYLRSVGDQGNVVHQLLFNAQRRGDSGEGWLRLLEFQPDGQSVIIKTFSPWLQQRKLASWRSDQDDYFRIQLTPTVR